MHSPSTQAHNLPLHLVGLVTLAEGERRGEVAGEELDLLDVGDEGLVDGLLVGNAAAGNLLLLHHNVSILRPVFQLLGHVWSYLGLLALLEESLLTGLLLGLLSGEVLGLSNLVDLGLVDAGEIDLLGSGDDVAGVDATKGNTVDLEGAGDEKDTLVESLKEDDALATETASEEDQDGAGHEGAAGRPLADGLADL